MNDARRPIDKILEAAHQVDNQPDGSWMCLCPAHEDSNPSLHITEDQQGKIALHCFKGCKTASICHSWGMTVSELFPDHGSWKPSPATATKQKAGRRPGETLTAEYIYRDFQNVPVFRVVRYENADGSKRFIQCRSNGQGGFIVGMKGVQRVLFQLPELIASAKSEIVYIVEGEKKVKALEAWGMIATCNVSGAGKWLAAYNPYFRDRDVVILPDNDQVDSVTGACPGRDHAKKIISNLTGVAKSIRVVDLPGLPPKGDIVDWQAAGNTKEQFLEIISAPPQLDFSDILEGVIEFTPLNKTEDSITNPEQQTEVALSRRFADRYSPDLNYVPEWGTFINWSGSRWTAIKDCQVTYGKAFVDHIWNEVERFKHDEDDENQSNPLVPLAKKLGSKKTLFDVITLAKSEPIMVTQSSRLDCPLSLFNVKNGTIDLETGQIRKHDREDYLTKVCQIDFNPKAECPLWEKFVYQVMGEDLELAHFLQTWFGYCLTGDTREQKVPIFWGTGSNGKSVMLNTMLNVLGGDYGHVAPPNLLLAKKHEDHPTVLAGLFGKRLVSCSESDEGARLNEALIKQLSGGETIAVRKMYQDFWEYRPSFKLVLLTNHKPSVRGTDPGVWRRLLLIPFVQKFWDPDKGEDGPEELRQDKQLEKKLLSESPGILNWLVTGAKNWYENGLVVPLAAKAATSEYRDSEDVLQQFIDDCCLSGVMFKVRGNDIYSAYKKWAEGNGEFVMSQTKFGTTFGSRFQKMRSDGVWYLGVCLKETIS